jgi:hypothetical protein
MNVGVCAFDEPEPLTRGRSAGEGECGRTRCDFLLFETIMLTAQAARSTGVRLAAWMKGSSSCILLVVAKCLVIVNQLTKSS